MPRDGLTQGVRRPTGRSDSTAAGIAERLADTASDRVAARIREDILRGIFRSGARIKLGEMAARYEISLMPVRDALRQLASEGLVDLLPNRGARVRKVDRCFIENMYDLRSAIEAMLVERCAERIAPPEVREVWRLVEAHEAAVRRGSVRGMLAANGRLHREIYRVADNPEALRLFDCGWELLHALRLQFGFGADRLQTIIGQHRALAAAIEARDPARAARVARAHCAGARDDLVRQFDISFPAES